MITARIALVLLGAVLAAGCSGGGSKIVPPAGTPGGGDPGTNVVNRLTGEPVPFGTHIPVCSNPKPGQDACHAVIVALGVVGPGIGTSQMGTASSNRAIRSYPGGAPYIPMDLWTAYNTYLDAVYSGAGHSIWIVDAYDDPNAEADLQIYRNAFNLPTCSTANGCFHKYNQQGVQGNYPLPDSSWAVETSLDLDMVSAMCPHCNINLVEANDPSRANLYYAAGVLAASAHADAITMSFGHNEDVVNDVSYNSAYFSSGAVAGTPSGNLFIASAGDAGYGPGFPASSPNVMSVGGTTLNRAVGTARLFTETGWSGTGGGCSAVQPKPSWQVEPFCQFRFGNDISAVADPNTGVYVYDSYLAPNGQKWVVVGGTSVSAPLIAGIVGVSLNGRSITNHYMYGKTGALNDITLGNNQPGFGNCTVYTWCNATTGQDGPTGWGTPNTIGAL